MKKLFNLMVVAAMLVMGAACTQNEEVDTPAPKFEVAECPTVSLEGETVELEYTLTNPVAGVVLEASEPTVEWIHDIVIGEEKISFVVDAYAPQFGAEARTGSFDLTYGALAPQTVTVTQSAPVTTFTVGTVEALAAVGGEASVTYAIENAVAGAEVVPSEPTAEWLHDVTVGEGVVTFVVDEYDAEYDAAAREASFELTYGTFKATVAVSQNAPLAPFAVTFTDVTPLGLTVNVVPTDATMTYFVNKTFKTNVEAAASLEALVLSEAQTKDNSYIYDIEDYLATGNYPVADNYMLNGKFEWYEYELEKTPCIYVCGVSRDESNNIILTTKPMLFEAPLAPYPVLSISPLSAEAFSAEAGTCTFSYTVENPMEGDVVSATVSTNAPWAHDVVVSDGTITFSYDANPYNVARSGEISVTYNKYTSTCKFAFSQQPNANAEKVTFNLEVLGSHYDHIVVNCTPSNTSAKYVLGVVSKKKYENSYYHNSDPAKIPELDLASVYKPETQTGALTNFNVNGVNIDDYSYGGLEWYVYAYAVDDSVSIAVSDVTMQLVMVVDDRPSLAWDDSRVYEAGTYYKSNNMDVAAASATYTVKYALTNGAATGVVKAKAESNYYGVIDESSIVVDAAAQTVSFKVNDYDASQYSHTGTITVEYFSSATATTAGASVSVKVNQQAQ